MCACIYIYTHIYVYSSQSPLIAMYFFCFLHKLAYTALSYFLRFVSICRQSRETDVFDVSVVVLIFFFLPQLRQVEEKIL